MYCGKFTKFNGSYSTIVENFCKNDALVTAKMDIGAVCTVISPSVICNRELSDSEIVILEQVLKDKTLITLELKAYSGESKPGFLVCKENVRFSGLNIRKLFCFIPMIKGTKFLLGNDIFDFITYQHQDQSDIIISGLNEQAYVNFYKKFCNFTVANLNKNNKKKGIAEIRYSLEDIPTIEDILQEFEKRLNNFATKSSIF